MIYVLPFSPAHIGHVLRSSAALHRTLSMPYSFMARREPSVATLADSVRPILLASNFVKSASFCISLEYFLESHPLAIPSVITSLSFVPKVMPALLIEL